MNPDVDRNSHRVRALRWMLVDQRRQWFRCLLAGLIVASGSALAASSEQSQASAKPRSGETAFPDYATVEELLRLDAQAALLAARRAVTNPLDEQKPLTSVPQGNALLSIFGTDRVLSAEVQIGNRIVTYRSAVRRPVAGGPSPYLLEKIDPPCIHLSQGSQREVLCLSRVQP